MNKGILLTDREMAKAQGDKDACLAVIEGFGNCKGCSVNCHCIAQAQLAKAKKYYEVLLEEAKRQERQSIQNLYMLLSSLQAKDGDIVIPREDWQALKGKTNG